MDGRVSGMGRLVDWSEVLLDLRRHGLTQTYVAKVLNVPRQTVNSWSAGSEPAFSEGMRLVRLHALVVEKRPTPTSFAVQVSCR